MNDILNIKFNNPNQILGMGGPWIGDLSIQNKQISQNVIIDNIILDKNLRRVYFIVYKKASKWVKKNYFLVRYLDINTNKIFEFENQFNMIFIHEIDTAKKLVYYDAFHGENINLKKSVILKNPSQV